MAVSRSSQTRTSGPHCLCNRLTYRLIWRPLYSPPPIEASGESSAYRRHDTKEETGHAKTTIDAGGEGLERRLEINKRRGWRETRAGLAMDAGKFVFRSILIGDAFAYT